MLEFGARTGWHDWIAAGNMMSDVSPECAPSLTSHLFSCSTACFHKNLLRQHEYEPILFSSAEAFGNHGDFDRVVCVLLGRLLRWHLGRPMPALPVN
jgi:hypothetical protein